MSCNKTLASVDKPHYLLEVVLQPAGGKKHIVNDRSDLVVGNYYLIHQSVFEFSAVQCFRLVPLVQLS